MVLFLIQSEIDFLGYISKTWGDEEYAISPSLSASYFFGNLSLSAYRQNSYYNLFEPSESGFRIKNLGVSLRYSFFLNESISIEPELSKVIRIKTIDEGYLPGSSGYMSTMNIWDSEHDSSQFPLIFRVNFGLYFNK